MRSIRILWAITAVLFLLMLLLWHVSNLPSHPLGDHYAVGQWAAKVYLGPGDLRIKLQTKPTSTTYPTGDYGVSFYLSFPSLLISLFLTALGLHLIVFALHRTRIPPGCCRHCAYDLRGNMGGICPECGKAA